MMKYPIKIVRTISVCLLVICIQQTNAEFDFPESFDREHPRLVATHVTQEGILHEIETRPEVRQAYERFKSRVKGHVERHVNDPKWMVSRLQMYWETRATDVFIKGGHFSHAEGKAPVPTVRYNGARDFITDYSQPKLEDIKPYMDDPRGIWVQHKESKEWSWTHPSKTGRIIEGINKEIMALASDAALVYWLDGNERYAKFAADLFNVYMEGIYHRNAPFDIEKGHHQTIAGLSSFQVIHEQVVRSLTIAYDFLYDYLSTNQLDKMDVYRGAFVKFAEQIIANGVPFNNWNLFQANYVIEIALVLKNDREYADGKGCQYFLERIFNQTSVRQWSFREMLDRGYDASNGIWNECPSYSIAVSRDFVDVVSRIEETMGLDLLPQMPVLEKAVDVLPQYLFPNRYIVGFGDTHYVRLSNKPMMGLVENAQEFGKRELEEKFTALAKMLAREEGRTSGRRGRSDAFRSLFSGKETVLDPSIQPAKFEDYMTQTFHAPNVSWLVQRNGLDRKHGLMISQVGSLGNHMHANGIAMELYGKGYVLGPEGGRGSSYFSQDYLRYYSRFPAHNTVVVDGISDYPEMKSHHGFDVNHMYPKSGQKNGYFSDMSFSDVHFIEPETNADQNRVMGIVRTSETSGYYVDIFRSRRKRGGDRYHDYFYHNLGQSLVLENRDGKELELSPSDSLTFADGDLFAYDYIFDKQSKKTDEAFKARFELSMEGEEEIFMDLWMNGETGREVFKVKTPPSEAFRNEMIPVEVSSAPLPAVVVRQSGEAWTRPFAAIFEPSSESEPSMIASVETFEAEGASSGFVGIIVGSNSGRKDFVFSTDDGSACNYEGIYFEGVYGVAIDGVDSATLFLGAGKMLSHNGMKIEVLEDGNGAATLERRGDVFFLASDSRVRLTLPYGDEKSLIREFSPRDWGELNLDL